MNYCIIENETPNNQDFDFFNSCYVFFVRISEKLLSFFVLALMYVVYTKPKEPFWENYFVWLKKKKTSVEFNSIGNRERLWQDVCKQEELKKAEDDEQTWKDVFKIDWKKKAVKHGTICTYSKCIFKQNYLEESSTCMPKSVCCFLKKKQALMVNTDSFHIQNIPKICTSIPGRIGGRIPGPLLFLWAAINLLHFAPVGTQRVVNGMQLMCNWDSWTEIGGGGLPLVVLNFFKKKKTDLKKNKKKK